MSRPPPDRLLAPHAILPIVALPIFLAISNQTAISVALPAIGADLGGLTRLPWIVTGYLLALTVAGPLYGVLGDSYGLPRMLATALWVYIAGTMVCTFAPSLELLAAGRLLQGLGGGGLMSMTQALVGQFVSPRDQGRAQGQIATIAILALTLGPAIGGLLVGAFGWRSLFLSTVPLAAVALAVLHYRALSPGEPSRRGFDVAGFVWLNVFVLSWTFALDLLKTPERVLPIVLAGAISVASLVTLVRRQRVSSNPLFPPALFTIVAVRRANVMTACHGAAVVALMTLLPLFQTILRGESTVEVAFTMLALTIAFGAGGILTGNLVSATGRLSLFPTLSLPVAGAGIVLLGLFGDDLDRIALLAIYVAVGISIGPVMAVVNITVHHAVPESLRGRASGTVTFFRSIGGVLGTAVASLVLFSLAPLATGAADLGTLTSSGGALSAADHAAWRTAFQWAFLTTAGFVFCGWTMALANPTRKVA